MKSWGGNPVWHQILKNGDVDAIAAHAEVVKLLPEKDRAAAVGLGNATDLQTLKDILQARKGHTDVVGIYS